MSKKLFTAMCYEAESFDTCDENGENGQRQYASAHAIVLNRSPKRAMELARQIVARKIGKQTGKMGGTPILHERFLKAPSGKVLMKNPEWIRV